MIVSRALVEKVIGDLRASTPHSKEDWAEELVLGALAESGAVFEGDE